ncbi:MAG: serine hydrolase domain-containing protein [Myxococcales bacterium]
MSCFSAALLASIVAAAAGEPAPDASAPPFDSRQLEILADEQVAKATSQFHVPGAVVVVVKDGEVVFAKGYGLANLETKTPVAADRTRFFVASVTKAVTATAVMQLVEQGKLDLRADVNGYLEDLPLAATYPEPVTLAHLLTHTSGIDNTMLGMGVPEGASPLPLGELLKAHPLGRVRPPGALFSYANRNYSLAGRLVEIASGERFADYVERHVLAPLGMEHSGFSLPAHLEELAVGYRDVEVTPSRRWPTPLMNDLPAGGLLATGVDIGRFMLAHLQDGRLGTVRILEEATARRMRERQYTFHPALEGMTYGFMEHFRSGRRALMHEGSMAGFFSLLYLVPELGLGIFVETNGGSEECDLVYDFPAAVLERFFASPLTPESPSGGSDLQALEGTYREPSAELTLERAATLAMAREAHVQVGADGALTVNGRRYREVEPNLFEREGSPVRIAFRPGVDGHASAMARGLTTYERVPWHGSLLLHRAILAGSLLVFLGTLVAWPLVAIVCSLRRRAARAAPGKWSARLAALMPFAFIAGVAVSFLGPMGPLALAIAIPTGVKVALVIPLLMPIPLALVFWAVFRSWRRQLGSVVSRMHRTAVGVAGLGFLFVLGYWNLLGFHF